ncbi:hypothetical protein [Paenibacillus sp. J2TS4]|uniref:hypothetical protein n=1 Tax=Paenibacillus sp. J2TS4 TaxID=2807194 RepID=UPI001B0EBCED|nr:hypothetical protein [Paenibacillus sp. J2TS4]GIP31927.1 hypothetical protein J2TS4_11370 [Paenibacillus sp. J2TS4]
MVSIELFHYYERETGPFRNLSDLSLDEARDVLHELRQSGEVFSSQRSDDYMEIRRDLEDRARELFIRKGGQPIRKRPHYMTLGECPWLKGWYREGRQLIIPIEQFDAKAVSFTYGDLFPTMRYNDDRPYRKQVYTMQEIRDIIAEYGMPQQWNKDGTNGPERYIEAQVWDNRPLLKYMKSEV